MTCWIPGRNVLRSLGFCEGSFFCVFYVQVYLGLRSTLSLIDCLKIAFQRQVLHSFCNRDSVTTYSWDHNRAFIQWTVVPSLLHGTEDSDPYKHFDACQALSRNWNLFSAVSQSGSRKQVLCLILELQSFVLCSSVGCESITYLFATPLKAIWSAVCWVYGALPRYTQPSSTLVSLFHTDFARFLCVSLKTIVSIISFSSAWP